MESHSHKIAYQGIIGGKKGHDRVWFLIYSKDLAPHAIDCSFWPPGADGELWKGELRLLLHPRQQIPMAIGMRCKL